MKFRSGLILCAALAGIGMLFFSTTVVIGISHRQPASLTLANTACRMLDADIAKPLENGFCKIVADDFHPNGKLVELWLASPAGPLFEGKTIFLPIEKVKLAIALPKRGVPLWIYAIFLSGIILLIGSIVGFGIALRKRAASNQKHVVHAYSNES